jgi:hypothetical protein
VIGGFAVYDLPSKAEAVELTREFLQMQIDIWPQWKARSKSARCGLEPG